MNFKITIAIIFILIWRVDIKSQKINSIKIYDQNKLVNNVKANSKNPKKIINDLVISSIEEGYLTTFLDSSNISNKVLNLYLNRGKQIVNNEINMVFPKELDIEFYEKFNMKNKFFNAIDFNYKITQWISQMNNNGFPFAEIEFENSKIDHKFSKIISIFNKKSVNINFSRSSSWE